MGAGTSKHQTQDFVDLAADRAPASGRHAPDDFVDAVPGDNVEKLATAHTGEIETIGSVKQDLVMFGAFGGHALGTGENVEA